MPPADLCCFDPAKGDLLAAASADGRLKIWDAVNGTLRHQLTQPTHLSRRFTCIDWWRASACPSSGKRSKEGVDKSLPLGTIALGTDSGDVVIWDLKRGIARSLRGDGGEDQEEGGESDAVTSISFAVDGDSLFVATGARQVQVWDLSSWQRTNKLKGVKGGTHCVKRHPSGASLAVAGSSVVRLVQIANGKKQRKFETGYSGIVSALAFTPNGIYLAAATSGSRHISLFDCVGATSTQAVLSISLASSARYLELYSAPADPATGSITLLAGWSGGAAVVRSGAGSSKEADMGEIKAALGKGVVRVCLKPDSAERDIVVACAGEADTKLVFEGASYVTSEGGIQDQILVLTGPDEDVAATKLRAAGKGPIQEHVIEPGERGVEGQEKDVRQKKRARGDMAGEQQVKDESGKDGMTIGERLAALSRELDAAQGHVHARPESHPPQAESLVTALVQALQSGDDNMLEHCLSVTDPDAVDSTVARLPSLRVLPLLERLVAKFEKKPARGAALCVWLRAILSRHTGYLLGVPSLSERLSRLRQMIGLRLKNFPAFLDLGGRLDLVVSHMQSSSSSGEVLSAPALVYNESDGDSSGSEEEALEKLRGEEEESENEDGSDESDPEE